MRLIVASSSLVAKPLVESLKESNLHNLIALITNPDKPAGRGQNIEPNSLAVWAESQNLHISKPSTPLEINEIIHDLKPDLIITIAYGHLVPKDLLSHPKFGWINVHFSKLPKWRGAAPVQWTILSGEVKAGLSIFKLDEGMDTGPVYVSCELDIADNQTTEDVLKLLSLECIPKVMETLQLIELNVAPIPQSDQGISYAKKFSKNDGRINWNTPATSVFDLYRAISHNPGIWSPFGDTRLRFNSLRPSDIKMDLNPGEILIENEKLYVGANPGVIEILQLTPAGRNHMSASEFIRGLTSRTGLNLG
ncbi:MAG: methionyl-tRNA formyltransferase [Actinobacteria bacterium]|nr:methionyl-tRNA formyltransferase [Actinomycetota bacterium]NBY82746.1 methionyl-tRNA formyltransferase [Actinomycetota bacterium]NDD79076.1 methionyl-tRNA formyltransferase [Actinomycetota bacterium]